jgi:hypothetical protein
MNCEESKELLVAYVEGLLEDSEQQAVAEHLKDCSACQAELQELTGLHDRLVTNGKTLAQSNLEKDVMNQLIREQNVRLKAATRATEALKIRRLIMRSSITRIAAAAAVIVVAALGVHYMMGPSVTFADVVKPLLNARTLILDMIVGDEETGTVIHDVIVDQRIRRVISRQEHVVNIIDPESAKMLTLHTGGKIAAYSDIQGSLQEGTRDYVASLRKIISDLQNNPDFEAKELGEKEIDGQKVIGFSTDEFTIWADAETALPVRIEVESPQLSAVFKNFQFNVPVEELESLVSMDLPDGYTEQKKVFDMTTSTEQDLVECLRIWAEVLMDGNFPEAIGMEELMTQLPQVEAKLAESITSAEEGTQKGMTLGKGMLFHMTLKDKHYAGSGVKVGEADKAVFWYLPDGADTYRVIYGDLSVKDVAEENLPK